MIYYSVTEKATGKRLTIEDEPVVSHERNDRDFFTLEEALQKTQHNFDRFEIVPYVSMKQILPGTKREFGRILQEYVNGLPLATGIDAAVQETFIKLLEGFGHFLDDYDDANLETARLTQIAKDSEAK